MHHASRLTPPVVSRPECVRKQTRWEEPKVRRRKAGVCAKVLGPIPVPYSLKEEWSVEYLLVYDPNFLLEKRPTSNWASLNSPGKSYLSSLLALWDFTSSSIKRQYTLMMFTALPLSLTYNIPLASLALQEKPIQKAMKARRQAENKVGWLNITFLRV